MPLQSADVPERPSGWKRPHTSLASSKCMTLPVMLKSTTLSGDAPAGMDAAGLMFSRNAVS